MEQSKCCPFRGFEECIKNRCEWWVYADDDGACAVRATAQGVGSLNATPRCKTEGGK